MHQDSQGGAAGGEEEEEGSSAANLLEALRQFRLSHRGEYRQVLEQALSTYRLSCGTGATTRTDPKDEPASPPPSPATEPLSSEEGQDEATTSQSLDELSGAPTAWPYLVPTKPSPAIKPLSPDLLSGPDC